jgi:hypothetical protein
MEQCPICDCELADFLEIEGIGILEAAHDPEGQARVDIIATCTECDSRWNVFVPLKEFFANPLPDEGEEA